LSPCDRTAVSESYVRSRKEKVDEKIRRELLAKLLRHCPSLGHVRIGKAKSGLRTIAPDGRFVIGEDPNVSGFFWVAGLGGHGVTTSFSVGELAARLVTEKKVDVELSGAVSPARFMKREG